MKLKGLLVSEMNDCYTRAAESQGALFSGRSKIEYELTATVSLVQNVALSPYTGSIEMPVSATTGNFILS